MAETNNIILDVKIKGERDLQDLSKILDKSSSSGKELQNTLNNLKQIMISTQAACSGLTSGTTAYAAALDKATQAANNFRNANAQVASSFGSIASTNPGKEMAASFSATEGILITLGQELDGVTKGIIEMNNVAQSNVATQGIVATQAGFNAMRGNVQGVTSAIVNMNSVAASGLDEQRQSVVDLAVSYTKLSQAEVDALDPDKVAKFEGAIIGIDELLSRLASDMDRATDLSASVPGIDFFKTQAEKARAAYTELVSQILLAGGALEHTNESSAEAIAITAKLNEEFERTGTIAAVNTKVQNTSGNQTQKTVGNATKQYNGLAMAIAQVGREVPNFFYSMQIGFMAISNNLPILIDQMKAAKANGESMGKAFKTALGGANGAMLLFIIASTQAGKVIEWITAKLNEIPQDIKIKIEIESESLKKTEEIRLKIAKFQLDYNKAQKDGNITQLKFLDDYALKEFGIHKDKLKQIMANESAQKAYFASYLKMAEDTYYNEEILKRKAQADIAAQTAKVKAGELKPENIYKKAELDKIAASIADSSEDMTDRIKELVSIRGTDQKYLDSMVEYYKARKDALALPSLRQINTFYNKPPQETKRDTGFTSAKDAKDKKFITPSVATTEQYSGVQAPGMEEIKKFDEWYNERNAIIAANNSNLSTLYKDTRGLTIANNQKIEEARRLDINNSINFYKQRLDLAIKDRDEVYPATKQQFDDNEALYKKGIDDLNALYVTEANLKDNALKAEDQYNTDMSKAKTASEKKTIDKRYKILKEGSDKEIALNKQAIVSSKDQVEAYKTSRATLVKQLESLKNTPSEIEALQKKLEELDTQFATSIKTSADLTAESIQNKLDIAGKAFDAVGSLTSGIADLYKAEAQEVDNSYDAEESRINAMNVTDEERTELLKANEAARYEEKKKLFEKQKKWEEATAWINFASGVVAIWSKSFEELGPIAGPIVAGIETAGLLATTLANVKSIRAQKLDAPSSSSTSSASSGGSSANVFAALNPTESALKSKEENLANINSTFGNEQVAVVKVSDINKVQNNVSVRDNNTKY